MVLFEYKTMAGIFNYLVSWWNGQPFGQIDPLDKQISSELKIWKHLQSVLNSRRVNSDELAAKDIQQLHLGGFVGTDAHIQKLRAQMFPKSQSSSSEFSLVEDVIENVITRIVASVHTDNAALALFKEVLKIPGFPEEKIAKLFSPIITKFNEYLDRDSISGVYFFVHLLLDDVTGGKSDLLFNLIKLVPEDSRRIFLMKVFFGAQSQLSPERMHRFLEMSLSLDGGWINSDSDNVLVNYCTSPHSSSKNLQKIIDSTKDYKSSYTMEYCLSYLKRRRDLLKSIGIVEFIECLKCLGDKTAHKMEAFCANKNKYLVSEATRYASMELIYDFFDNFEERIRDDDHVNSFIDVYLDYFFSRSGRKLLSIDALNAIKMNQRLKLSGELLARVLDLIESCHGERIKDYNVSLVAIQNCDDIKDVEDYFLNKGKKQIPETIDQFLSLPVQDQQHLMTGFVLFRDRKGLQLVSELLKQAGGGKVAAPVLKSALTLLKKTQILHDPDADETHLLNLIFSLWISTEESNHRETEHILSEAVLALSELDFVRLKSQYRSGIFEIFKTLVNSGRADPSILNVFVQALGLYSYDASKIEDREILDFLIPLMKKESTSLEMKFSLAKMLATIKYEPGLLSAWDVIKSPLWDRYARHEEGEERKVMRGSFDLYNFLPFHLHENRGVIKRRILDLLAELNLKDKDLPALFKEFYERNPDKLRALSKFQSSLEVMPLGGVRYFDPLYLPKGSFVFRGINRKKGDTRALDGLLDLFERGAGDSELTKASADSGTWAKMGQIFCALDKHYVKDYVGELGAFIVIKGDYVNQAIQKRRVRQQREAGSTHYVLYDTVSHQNIEKIYIAKPIFSELQKLRNAESK